MRSDTDGTDSIAVQSDKEVALEAVRNKARRNVCSLKWDLSLIKDEDEYGHAKKAGATDSEIEGAVEDARLQFVKENVAEAVDLARRSNWEVTEQPLSTVKEASGLTSDMIQKEVEKAKQQQLDLFNFVDGVVEEARLTGDWNLPEDKAKEIEELGWSRERLKAFLKFAQWHAAKVDVIERDEGEDSESFLRRSSSFVIDLLRVSPSLTRTFFAQQARP